MKQLFVFEQLHCPACAEAEVHLQRWQAQHWADYMVIRLNVSLKDWEKHGYDPKSTPAYLLVDENGERLAKHEGVLEFDALENWVKKAEGLYAV